MKDISVFLRRTVPMVLSVLLCLSCLLPYAAAEDAVRVPAPVFADVHAISWFYGDIMRLYEAGVVSGYPDGRFRPDSPVTCAESLKMILSAADGLTFSVVPGQPWYQPYYTYAREKRVADLSSLSPDAPISRASAAKLIVRAMGLPLNAGENRQPFADFADVYALTLYDAGILRGETSGGLLYFRGERPLSRAELATLVSRMMDYLAARPVHPAEARLLPAGVELPEAPTEVEDFVQMLICLSVSGVEEQTFTYRDVRVETVRDVYLPRLREAYPIAADLCRESVIYYHYYDITLAYIDDYVTMTVALRGRDYTAQECRDMFTYTLERAKNVSEEILAEMVEAGEHGDRTYARRCLDWVSLHCDYLDSDRLVDQYAYSVFRDGTSVCSGYTAAYNLLLKLGGIRCMSVTGTARSGDGSAPHAWTVAELDGELCMIDATWCDRGGLGAKDSYFALDEETVARDHTPEWDWRSYWAIFEET